ncbi:LANO_0D07998g1_1 [Lachancea nothofagi CBS 11611]|uniref:LANO_0D07998g1_1 n=1 Tax=Lachancea nothofagi CBS 11611 TaxID=1266666 RepID=A0A1G4JIM0_9SACH|nr:LANO_0D07998g1_1 [Lachancea nothofagi CBS 11611]
MNITDRRRILGPSNAKSLTFDRSDASVQEDQPKNISSGPKNDTMYIENGIVCNSNGSSYLEVKDRDNVEKRTLLLTSVYGPRPSRGAFNAKASLSVQFKEVTLEKIPAGELREVCNFLTNVFNAVIILDRYPKSGIDIFLSLIHSSNGSQDYDLETIITACVNGITLALIDAGIEIFDTVSAGLFEKNVTVFMKNGTEIAGFWKDDNGSVDEDLLQVIEKCRQHYSQNRKTIIDYVVRSRNGHK